MKTRTLQACIVAALAIPAGAVFARTGEADASGCGAQASDALRKGGIPSGETSGTK